MIKTQVVEKQPLILFARVLIDGYGSCPWLNLIAEKTERNISVKVDLIAVNSGPKSKPKNRDEIVLSVYKGPSIEWKMRHHQ